MKNIHISGYLFVLSGLIALTVSSCKKEEVHGYQGAEGVYFAVQYGASWGDSTQWAYHAQTAIDFVSFVNEDTTHRIRVAITGEVKNYDRTVNISIEADSTTAVESENYLPLQSSYVVKAGHTFVDIPITLKRSDNITEKSRRICLKLSESSDFTLSVPVWYRVSDLWSDGEAQFDATRHFIVMSNFMVRPSRWIGQPQDDNVEVGTQEAGRWGKFSVKKLNLIIEHMKESSGWELSYLDFTDASTMPNPRQAAIQEEMANYLTKLYNAGTPVLEDDGRLMWFMGVSWSSYVGVPYVPEN